LISKEKQCHIDDKRKQEVIRAHYDDAYYAPLVDSYRRMDRFTRYRIEKVFEIYMPKKGERVLDLGCGVGTISLELAKRGIDVIGLDYSQQAINICRSLSRELHLSVEFALADATSTGFPPTSFDVVFCADLVEHLYPEIFKSLISETKRILKVGGKFIIWTPNPGHIIEFLKKRNMILKRDEGHVGYRTLRELRENLQEQGFRIDKAYHRESHLPIFYLLERLFQRIIPLMRRRNAVLATKLQV